MYYFMILSFIEEIEMLLDFLRSKIMSMIVHVVFDIIPTSITISEI